MSSSTKGSMFPLHADPSNLREILEDAYCPAEQIEDNPIIEICQYFIFGADRELEIERPEKYGGDINYDDLEELKSDFSEGELHPQDLKQGVAEKVIEAFKPVREKFKENPELLDPLEEIGHERPDYLERS
jgi:tyrosyl-tRNA synthetase